MTAFNPTSPYTVEFEAKEDGVLVHLGEDTLGINPNKSDNGFSLTPDWNDRHLTLAFSENSVLYHLTNERSGERPGEGNIQPEGFVADVYGAVRSLGHLEPVEQLDLERVGRPKFDDIEDFLREYGIIERTNAGLTVNREKQHTLVSKLKSDKDLRKEFYNRILTPLTISEAIESGDNIFAIPGDEEFYLIFLYPDEYASIVEIREFYSRLVMLTQVNDRINGTDTGSQIIYFLAQALMKT